MLLENIKIVTVGDERTGKNPATGRAWRQRNIVLGFDDETGESFISAQVDGGLWERLGHRQGDTVNLHLRLRTKNFQSGWVANDIRIIDPESL